jgi:regulatory protein
VKGAPLSLRARALGWLAQREHSRLELRRKLLRVLQKEQARQGDEDADPPDAAAEVDALLDELAAAGHLSEARFIESRVYTRASRLGTQRIRLELAQHGLALDAEQQAQLRASELDRARLVWRKRFGGQGPADAADWARQSRFLAARGFGADVVRQLLRGGGGGGDADTD